MIFPRVYMHIPDGFLSVTVSVVFWVISIIFILIALRRVNRELGEREVPVMGVLAAAIFAGQMLNFAVGGGTSGHLMGAALAAILLGPWASVLVLTSVVTVQALVFQDGGLLALGTNLFNMGVVGSFTGYGVYRLFQFLAKGKRWGVFGGGFAAAWVSIVCSAVVVGLELALSGTSPANIAIPAMAGVHGLIGIGEGLITLGALSFIYAARRDLLKIGEPQPGSTRIVLVGGLAFVLLLAVLSPLASRNPDGLLSVAAKVGFLQKQQIHNYGIIPHYLLPGISNQAAATIIAGVIGAIIVLGVALLVGYTRRRRSLHNEMQSDQKVER